MSHLTGTGERNAVYIEQEAEHATRESRAENRERHNPGYAPYTPQNNAIRARKQAANHNCDVLDAWINRMLGYQRTATHAGVRAVLGVAIESLRAQELVAKLEEREAEEAFKAMLNKGVNSAD